MKARSFMQSRNEQGGDQTELQVKQRLLAFALVLDGCEPLFRQSLAIRAKALGLDHPDVARALNNLAEIYQKQGRSAEAKPPFRRALAIFKKERARQADIRGQRHRPRESRLVLPAGTALRCSYT
jgi:tetratricopeptide (TPR) repeat protein